MVKSIISTIIALSLLIVGGFLEQRYVEKEFGLFEDILKEMYIKIENEECNKEYAESVQKWWLTKKESLHIYIPHNDIREIDYWLAETVSLVYTKDFNEALSKVEVLIEISEHIPDTYRLKLANIF